MGEEETPVTDGPVYKLTLRSAASSIPPAIRLRRLLKLAGRVCAFRCIEVVEVADRPPVDADASGGPADGAGGPDDR
jgi:hypothetical protein